MQSWAIKESKPQSPYLQFAADTREEIIAKFVAKHRRQPRFAEVGQLLGERWKEFSAAKRRQQMLPLTKHTKVRAKRHQPMPPRNMANHWSIILTFVGYESSLAICNRALSQLAERMLIQSIPLRKAPWIRITERTEGFRDTVPFLHKNALWRADIRADSDIYRGSGMPDNRLAFVTFVRGNRRLKAEHDVGYSDMKGEEEDVLVCSRNTRKLYDSLCDYVEDIDHELFRRLAYETFEDI